VEAAAQNEDSKALYRIVKDLSGPERRKSGVPIKDNDGTTMSTHKEQAMQWNQHSETVLNSP
jgi:hypothetical protein